MPTKEQITEKVMNEVAQEANVNADIVELEQILADPPLTLDKIALGMLTSTLRKYIKSYRSDRTLLVKEVRKSGLSVKALISLVNEKFQ